jgi:hypothetical protein
MASKRRSVASPAKRGAHTVDASHAFERALSEAVLEAAASVREKVGGERLYAFALYTSGQSAFSYVCASANTEEALSRALAAYASRPTGRLVTERDLRWNACDWEWHDFAPSVAAIELPSGAGSSRDRLVKRAFHAALRAVDETGVIGSPRPAFALVCGDMSDAFLLESIEQLNPEHVAADLRARFTPAPYLEALEALAPGPRLEACLELYRDLMLRRATPAALDAQRSQVTEHALEPSILRLGPPAASRLVALAENVIEGPTFHVKGSADWKEHGAFTRPHVLATSAIRLASRIGLGDGDVESLQRLVRRRIEIDRDAAGPVSLIPVVAARALHAHDATRFPAPKQGASTNRLENAEAFVSPARPTTGSRARASRSGEPARSTRRRDR